MRREFKDNCASKSKLRVHGNALKIVANENKRMGRLKLQIKKTVKAILLRDLRII